MIEAWFSPVVAWLGVGSFSTLLLLVIAILLLIKVLKD